MNSMAMPRSAFRRCSSARMLACTETSSADRISSQSSSAGSAIRAAGDGDALALAAGQLVGKAPGIFAVEPDVGQRRRDVFRATIAAEEELQRPRQRLGDRARAD